MVWVFGVQFALRTGQEHRNLRFKNSRLSLKHDESGCEFLKYMESISITNNRILRHLRVKRKVVRAYKNLANAERCPVELNKKYLSHVPKEIVLTHFICVLCPNRKERCGNTISQWE